MSKADFKFENVPIKFGDKDAAYAMQGLVGIAWIVMAAAALAYLFISGDDWAPCRIAMGVIMFAAIIYFNVVNWSRLGDRLNQLYYSRRAMEKLAKANGLKISGRRKEQYDKEFYPAIAELGMRPYEEFGCEGEISGVPISIYVHSYRSKWIGYDLGRTWTLVTHLTMPRLMPHTFLQTRNNVKSPTATSVARTFDDNQRVSLQNDLDKYFIFYTHRRTVTDALALWSPQLLYELRELKCQLSVETIGKDIYIYSNSENDDGIDMEKQMKFVEAVTKSFQRSLRVEFLKLPNDTKYPFLRSRSTGGLVSFAGKYFAYGWIVLAYYIINSGVRLAVEGGPGADDFWWKTGLMVVVIVVASALLIYSRSSYTRTKTKRGI